MPLVILAVGILLLFFLIVRVKLNSFISLLIVAGLIGYAEGLPVGQIIPVIQKGLGGTLGGLAIVVSFGAILGKLMAESGGAQRIAMTLIHMFGREKVKWAVCLTGFIVGIALFYEIGFVLLIPLVFTIAASAQIRLLEVGIPMAAALSVTHGFLPPHPGPTAISVIYNADIGLTLVYGAILAVPTAIVAGPLFYNFVKDLNPAIPEGLYNPKVFTDEEMPSFGVSVFTALVPVVLMAASTIGKLTLAADSHLRAAVRQSRHSRRAVLRHLWLRSRASAPSSWCSQRARAVSSSRRRTTPASGSSRSSSASRSRRRCARGARWRRSSPSWGLRAF